MLLALDKIRRFCLRLLMEITEAKTQLPEDWASKPITEWPQIVLTNSAEFNGHTPLEGASSFLLQNDTRGVFAATAKHLLAVLVE